MSNDVQFCLSRTSQLSPERKWDFERIFEATFQKGKTVEAFDHQFRSPDGRDSYHVYAMQDGKMVAIYSFLPCRYMVNGKPMLFALGCDSIVTKEANLGIGGLLKMYKLAEKEMIRDGISFFFGVPNDNYYEYVKNILKLKEICILDFYLLPLNPGKIVRCLRFADCFCRSLFPFLMQFRAWVASSKKITRRVEKVNDELFIRQRYGTMHHFLKLPDGSTAVYTVYSEEKMDVAYLVDLSSLSAKNFYQAMAMVGKAVNDKAAVVAYPCNRLPFHSFLRVPQKLLPRKLHFLGRFLQKEDEEKFPEFRDGKNWNMNLSNFDVR